MSTTISLAVVLTAASLTFFTLLLLGVLRALREITAHRAEDRQLTTDILSTLAERTATLQEELASQREVFRLTVMRLSEPVPGHELPAQVLAFMQENQRFLIQALQSNAVQANSRIMALLSERAHTLVFSQEHAQRDQAFAYSGPQPDQPAPRRPRHRYPEDANFSETAPDSSPIDTIRDEPPLSASPAFTQRDHESPSLAQTEDDNLLRAAGIDPSDLELPPESEVAGERYQPVE